MLNCCHGQQRRWQMLKPGPPASWCQHDAPSPHRDRWPGEAMTWWRPPAPHQSLWRWAGSAELPLIQDRQNYVYLKRQVQKDRRRMLKGLAEHMQSQKRKGTDNCKKNKLEIFGERKNQTDKILLKQTELPWTSIAEWSKKFETLCQQVQHMHHSDVIKLLFLLLN